MPLTFQGGQSLPPVGSVAYKIAQAAPNASAKYDPNTGMLIGQKSLIPSPAITSPSNPSTITPTSTTTPPGSSSIPIPADSTPSTPVLPLSSSPGNDTGFTAAQNQLTPPSTPTPPPMTEDQLYAYYAGRSSSLISAAQETEAAAEAEANKLATQETSQNNFASNARGMAGSSEANAQANQIEKDRGTNILQAMATKDQAIGTIMQNISSEAHQALEDDRSFYESENIRNDTLAQNYIATRQAQAQNWIKSLAIGGHTLDEAKAKDPQGYQSMLQYFNGDENTMKAAWIAASQPNQIGDPIQSGSNLIYVYKDPTTGKMITQSIDTGTNLTADNIATNVPGVGVVVTNKRTGTASVISGTANPYYLANQKATLDSKDQTINTKNALIATRIIGSQISKDASIQNFMAVQPIMQRIQSASDEISSNGINETNAAALLDDITKLNTQGQAITLGQVGLTDQSLSLMDQAKVLQQKIAGSGGVIDPKVAQDILKLSNDNYSLYEQAYKQHIQIYQDRLKNVNGQDLTAYSPLTDISNLPSVVDGSYASGLQSTLSTPSDSTPNVQVGDVVQDASGLPDGTTGTDDSGNSMVVQGGQWVSQ